MRPWKTDRTLLSTPSKRSNTASRSPSPCTTVVEEEVEPQIHAPSPYCFIERPSAAPPREAAKLKKRHNFVGLARRESQKEQIRPLPETNADEANVKTPLSKPPPPRASLLQFPNYKKNSLWLNRKTKLLGISTADNAPPTGMRRDTAPNPSAPVLRIGPPMLLMPMDAQRRRPIHRRSLAQGPWQQHPLIVVDQSFASAASSSASVSVSASVDDKPRPMPPPTKRISHRRSTHVRSGSIATSLSMYSQSSCGPMLQQRPASKVLEEKDLDVDRIKTKIPEDEVDGYTNRDSMARSAESGWTAASYHSTAQCVWEDTQWDFVPPPTGVPVQEKWRYFLESDHEDEDALASSESTSIEVTLPYLDPGSSSAATTPTSMGGATFCSGGSTPTLISGGMQSPFKEDKFERYFEKEEERTSLLCLDYDYTAAIDQIVHGDRFDDDGESSLAMGLGRKPVPGPTSAHPQSCPPAEERPTCRPGHRTRPSQSSYKTISRRPSSNAKRAHRLSRTPRKEFGEEKGALTHTPAAGGLRRHRRSLSKGKRSSVRGGETRRSLARPAMPVGFNLKEVAPLRTTPAPVGAAASLPSSTVALAGNSGGYGEPLARSSQLEGGSRAVVVEGQVVSQESSKVQTKTTRPDVEGRFGKLEGRGEDNLNSEAMGKPKQKKSIFHNVVHFFAAKG